MGSIDYWLKRAKELKRVTPEEAQELFSAGGLLIDIRPAAQRAQFGDIPDALVVERNNLEWRLDPQGSHRLPEAEDPTRPVVIICQEGYASSLAAASLLALGRKNATDLDGGFVAWKAAGLATTEPAG